MTLEFTVNSWSNESCTAEEAMRALDNSIELFRNPKLEIGYDPLLGIIEIVPEFPLYRISLKDNLEKAQAKIKTVVCSGLMQRTDLEISGQTYRIFHVPYKDPSD